ncbi:MAG: ABC transporter permease [SAR202 cluster bacterium]|nr:ABC transporter permease [SAR202 cluster bacterium]
MARFIFRRSIYSIVALLGATMIVFGLSRAVGDPRDLYIQEGGYGTSAETRAVLEKQLNLDRPLAVQYSIWVGRVLRGDMGDSVFTRIPVSRQIMESGPRTLRLGIVSWILATGMGIPLGIIAAVYRGTYIDKLSRTFALLGQAAPPFWIGIMAILLFSVKLRWLPAGTEGDGLAIRNYVMPAFTLGWLAAAGYMRITRSAMLEVLDSEFVKLARAKGVSEWKVVWKHAFRNALIPPLTVSALLLAGFITGAVVVETVFAWPGLGRLAVDAVSNNDYPLMTGTVLVFAVVYLLMNLLTDIAYAFIDPRIRYG